MKNAIPYTVIGRYPFPVDMLRYDGARAATAEDQEKIDRLSAAYAMNRDDIRTATSIRLVADRTTYGLTYLSSARWRSFGWEVAAVDGIPLLDNSNPHSKSPPTTPHPAPNFAHALSQAAQLMEVASGELTRIAHSLLNTDADGAEQVRAQARRLRIGATQAREQLPHYYID